MNFKQALQRIFVGLVLVALLAVEQPPQAARAEASTSVPGDGFGQLTLPPPETVHVPMTSTPPTMTAAELARMEKASARTGLHGPKTAAGSGGTPRLAPPALPPISFGDNGSRLPGTFTIFENSTFAGGPPAYRSDTNEPSAASRGRDIFATYNWYAGRSIDYGNTWSYINPATAFPTAHAGFCCDQDVIYDPSRDVTFWLLLYSPDSTGNILRLALANGQAGLESGTWTTYELVPQGFCAGTAAADWFDFPHLALTNNYLYIVSNVFTGDLIPGYRCTTVIRLSLDELAAHSGLTVANFYYASSPKFNFTAAQGGTDTLYFALHEDALNLRIYSWPESVGGGGVSSTLVANTYWLWNGTYTCKVGGVDGKNPCGYEDGRIKSGWFRRSNNELGFMWDVPGGTDSFGTFPYPYLRVVTMDATTKGFVHDTYAWLPNMAILLPSSGVNARGHVGGTITVAGGTTPPNCAAWIYDDLTGYDSAAYMLVTSGTGVPGTDRWGDYLRTRPDGLNPYEWQGTCYAIEGGVVTPRVVRFGRQRDDFYAAGKYDDSEAGWNYLGSWVSYPAPGPGAYDNTLHVALTAGSTARFSFKGGAGTHFYFTYVTNPGLGNIQLFLDGSVSPLTTLTGNLAQSVSTYTSPSLTGGPEHSVMVKHSGPGGTYVAFDSIEAGVTKYDDGDVNWTYAPAWFNYTVPSPGAYMNTVHIIGTNGATATFPFTGTQFALTYVRYPGFGSFGIYVDGNPTPVATIDANGTAALPLYTSPVLTVGAHSVTVKDLGSAGAYVAIDSIDITP